MRRRREMEAHLRLHRLDLPGRHHVELHHEVVAWLDAPGRALDPWHRRHPGCPAEQVTFGRKGVAELHAVKAWLGVPRVTPLRRLRPIQPHEGVMNETGAARPELDGLHEARRRHGHGHHEIAPDFGAVSPQLIADRQRDHQVGLAQLPAIGNRWRGGQVRWVAFGRALLVPLPQKSDLVIREAALTRKHPETRRGKPGGHHAPFGDLCDQPRAAPHVVVGQEREWRRFSRTMAGGTTAEHDGGNVARVRDRFSGEGPHGGRLPAPEPDTCDQNPCCQSDRA